MTDYKVLDIEQVLYIHDQIIKHSLGKEGIRDFALLHSALEWCKATFAGEDLYPDLSSKAAALLHSLIMNHPFLDANKRTAFAMMVRFLNANGSKLVVTQKEIVKFCVAVDNEGVPLKEIRNWIKEHSLNM